MNTKDIARARLALRNAGSPADREAQRSRLIAQLGREIETLRASKQTVASDYRRQLERWRTEDVAENVPVAAIPTEISESRVYRLTAVFALICEVGLAAWIFSNLGVPWWLGAVSAIGITFTLHGVFLQVFNNPERPKETVYRIKRYVSVPATIGFLVALAMAMLARYVQGNLALALLPVFSFSLWLATMSLLLLAASLFTLAHLKGWSLRHEKRHCALNAEERASADFLKELEQEMLWKSGAPSTQLPDRVVGKPDGKIDGRGATMAIAIIAACLWSTTGCAKPGVSLAADQRVESASADEEQTGAASLNVYIDASGSCVRTALTEAWANLRSELHAIVEAHRIGRIAIWHFDEDGWSPRLVKDIMTPTLPQPTPTHERATSEWTSFSNIRTAVEEAKEKELNRSRKADLATYRPALTEALHDVESTDLLPAANHITRGTDVVGLLARISRMTESQPQFTIVVTDLADTRYREFPVMGAPAGEMHLLVVFIPTQPRDATLAFGKPLSGSEQFAMRSDQLRRSAPWIRMVPHFQKALASFLN